MTTIEPASTDDLQMLADLWVELVRSQHAHGTHLKADANRSAARDVIGRYIATDDLLVAKQPRIVGFVMFHLETGLYEQTTKRGIIDNVFVTADARGQGIGTDLIRAAETALHDNGAQVVALSVLADNDDAQRLYAEMGYSPHRIELERAVGSDKDSNNAGE